MKNANDNLSRAASEIIRLSDGHTAAAEFDAGFDGGEFSGPAHGRMEAEEQNEVARRYGFRNADQLFDAIHARTNGKWMFFYFPPLMAGSDEYETDRTHGRGRNR